MPPRAALARMCATTLLPLSRPTLLSLSLPLRSPSTSTFPSPRSLHTSRARLAKPSDDFKHHPGGRERAESTAEMLNRMEAESRRRAMEDAQRETVGPFPLGVGASGRRKTWKSWRELNVAGKLGRTFRQSGNLLIILAGGGLFVVLTLALTTELFAKNSPSVLYSQCIDMIRDSDALNAHLLPPLSYTHTPHSAAPTRGSAPVVHRTVRHPVSGRDHLLITFWVHGRGRGEPEPHHWLKSLWTDAQAHARTAGGWLGLAMDPVDEPAPEPLVEEVEAPGPGFMGRLARSVTGRTSGVRSATNKLPPPGTYKVGECRADYVKNASGQYVMLSLVVDVPSSSASYPGRAVVFWSPEANREGITGRMR